MSDVKILAPLSARGTGIPRTSTQVPQRNPTGTANSHVSASPSAGARAQAQVASVRRPPQRRQDATVVLLDRPATRSPAAVQPIPAAAGGAAPAVAASQLPTVQIVERTRPSTAAAAAFTVEQMMLIGFLLDRYRENTMAINDAANTAVAEGALAVLGGLLQAAGAPVAPAQTMASQAPIADEGDQARGGQGGANVEASSASSTPSSPADSSLSAGDGIANSPATPTGERERP